MLTRAATDGWVIGGGTGPSSGDVPEEVLAGIDAHASRLGLSRVEYIRRRLAADAATAGEPVSVADLRSFADLVGDLTDSQVMGAAWQ